MDFIEKLFGISPDAGSGATELLLMITPVLILALVTMRRHLRRAPSATAHRK